MVKVKICGITSPGQAGMACEAGADAIGLVFFDKSPRYVSLETAKSIVSAVPPFVKIVGLFVNAPEAFVVDIIRDLNIDLLQFHGDENNAFCAQFGKPFIKAIRVRPDTNLEAEMSAFSSAKGFLLDAYHPEKRGGTGESFNWDLFPRQADKPLILAGGLNVDNVVEAINTCTPYAVDVSGGVESAPGVKSREKLDEFIKLAKQAG